MGAAGNDGPPRITAVNRPTLAAAGLAIPGAREVVEMYYEYGAPFVVDSSRFEDAFGANPTPIDLAIGETLASYSP